LQAAHLVGSVAGMANDAEFPWYKDVDIHLIFAAGAPALQPDGPFSNNVETRYAGLLIEAGLKPAGDYRSAEAVLANAEIADHVRGDNILYDPCGLLAALQAPVTQAFARRRWVQARCMCDQAGFHHILNGVPAAETGFGASGVVMLAGYAMTRLTALLCDATLRPPTTGGRSWLRAQEILAAWGRQDLYNRWPALFHMASIAPERAAGVVNGAAALFDRAVVVKRSPHPFGHKLHPHLRPYFVETCRGLLAEGHAAEAALWAMAFFLAATDVLQVDGPPAEQEGAARQQAALLAELELETPVQCRRLLAGVTAVGAQVGALAETIVAGNPEIRD
jgi:hypothetical protein